MVQDIRRIILSETELAAAIESYRRVTPDFLPTGTMKSCKPCDLQHIAVLVEVAAGNTVKDVELKLSCGDLLRPLIRFCLENNIMLPRDGKKAVMIANGLIALHVTLDLDVDCTELVNPMRTSHIAGMSPADLLPKTAQAAKR